MERESFEDEELAELLNRDYVAIKVDREERPDIDQIYMSVCHAMTGQGGWPLTVLMTPEKKPFFAGTYFPKHRKYGRYGLMDILTGIAAKWREDREGIVETGDQVVERIRQHQEPDAPGDWDEGLADRALKQFEQTFDPRYGGFGAAPKFPTSHNLSFLLWMHYRDGKRRALELVEKTLDAMRRGGIYDHIGFGFSRYSTDEKWLVPHFEKMLYDNALLAMTYLEAYQLTAKPEYAETAEQIFSYVLRDMTDEGGAFYSAEDADSEGVEGKFYVWTPAEVKAVLGLEDGELFCDQFDITARGNFEGESIPNRIAAAAAGADAHRGGQPEGTLADERQAQAEVEAETARPEGWPSAAANDIARLEGLRQKLFAHRERRVHPHKDDKILTAWNGLMIMALAKGAKALGKRQYAEAAARAASFLLTKLRREDGRLLARYRDGEAAFPAYLDDYAFVVWGLIELFEATADAAWLETALELNRDMLKLFRDEQHGGFFFYGSDSEALFLRPKEIYDGALPSGNSAALYNLARLSRYTGDDQLERIAHEQLRAFSGELAGYPAGHALFLLAAELLHRPGAEIVIAGEPGDDGAEAMLDAARRRYAPDALLLLHQAGEAGEALRRLCPLVRDKAPVGGHAAAYVCRNFACQAPVTSREALLEELES